MTTQPDLFTPSPGLPASLTECDLADFRGALISAGTWQTRSDLCKTLGWPDRKVRHVAEALGSQVIRCQLGFKLWEQATRDDATAIQQGLDAFHSQASKMESYVLAGRRRLHALIG